MGKKNRNRGSARGRYDDMFDYAGGNDEDYQYSYQDEIDSAEFVEVENSQKDSRSRETMHPTEKNTKSQAAEERESWDFIKAKMDQSLSRLGSTPASGNRSEKTEKTSTASREEKEKKPKGPSAVSVFFGKVKSFPSTAFKKVTGVFKRKPKPENDAANPGKGKPDKKAELSGKDKPEKKPGVGANAFSFLKKKTETFSDAVKATRKKDETPNSGKPAASKGSKSTPEAQMRERRRTYLIIGSVTMCIVLLLLTAGILFIVNRSGKPNKTVAQNTETPAETEKTAETPQNDELSLPVAASTPAPASETAETVKETAPPSLNVDLDLPGLIDEPTEKSTSEPKADKKPEKKEKKKEKKSGESGKKAPSVDEFSPDLTVADIVNSDEKDQEITTDLADSLDSLVNESETKPAEEKAPENDPLKTSEKEEKTEDLLAGLDSLPELDASPSTAEKASGSDDTAEFPALTDPAPESDPLDATLSGNAMQEETPSLNETAATETEGKDSTSESSPALLDLPESVSPGSTTVSPTISRSEDQNQLPEEMGTPDGVTPGSNIDSWNTPANTETTDSGLSGSSLDLNAPGTDPLNETSSENDDLTAALAPPADSPSPKTSTAKESDSENSLGDFGQLGELDSSPAPASSFDSDLGSGIQSASAETLKGQKSAKYTNYTSSKDDTFWKISEKFYQTPAYEKALSRYNNDVVPDPNNLKEGTVLQIPDVNFLRSCYPTLCPQPLQVVQVPTSQDSNQTRGVQYYCAAEGDTLSLIAERLLGDSSRWPEIYRLNTDKVRDMDLVPAGVKLLIPADDSIPEQNIWQ